MPESRAIFGAELRRRRLAAGLSLAGLAAEAHYSKGHLSRVESGGKAPSAGLARRCDAVLRAGGDLVALLRGPGDEEEDGSQPRHADHWRLTLSADGGGEFVAASDIGPAVLARWKRNDRSEGLAWTLDSFDRMFRELRVLGQNSAPSAMVPLLIGHTHALRTHAAGAPPALRDRALLTAARYAEFTGWMCQEAGNDEVALWWTATAAEAAVVISGELARIPLRATRARARFGARLALAHAEADAIDEACEAADPVLAALRTVDSATVRNDIRDLNRALVRRHRNDRAREYLPRLSAALNERG